VEVTFAGAPYKGYPRFSSPDTLANALLDAGFNVLVNANNHALDRGKEGFMRTQGILHEKGVIRTGTFISDDRRQSAYPLLLEKNGILIAMLNFTYGTNGIKADTPLVVNYIDTLQILDDLQKVQIASPDFVIVCVHWGKEYQREENEGQRMLSEFMLRNGVDAIIGSHPHVVQPVRYEAEDSVYRKLVVYSLGNFISNQRDRYRDGGIIFGMELVKTDRTRIEGIDFMPCWVHKPKSGDKYRFRLIPYGFEEDDLEPMGFTSVDLEKYREFCQDTRDHLSGLPLMQADH